MAGVTRLAAGNGVLDVDQAQKHHLIAQLVPHFGVGSEIEEKAIGSHDLPAHGGEHVVVEAFLDRVALPQGFLILVPHNGAVIRRRHVHALHAGVAAGVFTL